MPKRSMIKLRRRWRALSPIWIAKKRRSRKHKKKRLLRHPM